MRVGRVAVMIFFGCLMTAAFSSADEKPAAKVEFKRTHIDPRFRSEGVAVADLNKDGKMDIAAGYVWYEAPEWKRHSVLPEPPEYSPAGYSNAFCTFADDLNNDGWSDLIIVDFPGTPTWWFANPQGKDEPWQKYTLTPVTNNESPTFLDIDGDGKRELVAAFSPDPKMSDGPDRQMAYFTRKEDPTQPWEIHAISRTAAPGTQKYSHGLGVGDVNSDGRLDILCGEGWWEAPESPSPGEWKFHPASFGNLAAQMYAFDYDGDGDADVLTSSPHAFGIWWHEQLPGEKWQTHEIEKSFSQTHAVCLADINRDGLPDFITGKRWWAHGEKGDPGSDQPAVFCWFELKRSDMKAQWTMHQFDDNSGIGTQFEVADVNGDGLLDVISSNKKGVHLFEQTPPTTK